MTDMGHNNNEWGMEDKSKMIKCEHCGGTELTVVGVLWDKNGYYKSYRCENLSCCEITMVEEVDNT